MEATNILTTDIVRRSLICRICGDVARGMNFNVITCMSCKAFFRRNALQPMGRLRCARKFHCDITKETRSNCAACRLKKCLAFNMNPQLIRSFGQYQLLAPRPLGLLQNDRSQLTSQEWNLLSNIIHVYDEQNFTQRIKCLLDQTLSQPIKLRAKSSLVMGFSQSCLAWMEFLLKQSPHFCSLSIHARRIVIARNTFVTGTLISFLISRTTNLYDDINYKMSFIGIYGDDIFEKSLEVHARLDSNDACVKMMLFVIIFSSNCNLITFDFPYDIEIISNSIDLFHLQNIFITLLWKYFIYQYGSNEAVLRYCSLMKIILHVISSREDILAIKASEKLIGTAMKQIEHSLINED